MSELDMSQDIAIIEIDRLNNCSAIQDYLLKITGGRSVSCFMILDTYVIITQSNLHI